jgi:S1-C subfamily serine protease
LYSEVTVLDWAIVAFTIALAIWGYRQGLIVGAMTLVGFGAGAFAGSRLGPLVLAKGSESPYAPLCAALGALLAGALVAVAVESLALGLRAKLVRRPALHLADGAGGAALIASVALGVVWVFGAVALHAPGTDRLRADVQESLILRSLNDVMPPSGPVLNALDRVDPAPSITGPAAPVGRPGEAIATDPEVLRAGDSVVRVLGTACGLGVEGSGWAVRPGLIVTNAHVIAGSDDTTVTTQGGVELDATPVYYGPEDDLALLRVGADLPTLPISDQRETGAEAAVLGYPENGPYAVAPARLGETRATISEDAYGNGPVDRTIVALRGEVRSGNSGGPLVDDRGRVLGTVFAATTSGPPGGFAIPAEDVRDALAETSVRVSTGECTG